jgi:ribosomal protein L2
VPAKAFRDALKPALKCRKFKPVLQNAAVVVGEHVVTFATTDLESGQVTPVRQLEGRFPPVPDIIPSGPPIATVEINGEELARLLKAACEFAGENQYVRLELHAGQPVVVRAENGSQTFVGLAVTQKDLAPENPEVES